MRVVIAVPAASAYEIVLALHIIAIGRLRTDLRTKAYIAKRVAEGHSKLEAIRCLKRYIAREVFSLISHRKREINRAGNAA